MLTPSYLLHATEAAEEIAEGLHQDILSRIIKRMSKRFERGDDYILTAADKWQIQTLQEAGYLLDDIQKEIAQKTGLMQKEIAEAMEDAGVKALDYDDKIYRAAGLNPDPLTQSPHLVRIMQRDYEKTIGEWKNFTGTTAKAAQQQFIEACDKAYHQALTGMISPSQAVKEALGELIEGGVYVKYPTGHTDTIETATARAVRTGISQASAEIQLARMDEFDVDLVLVSSHLGARPEHAAWQGKVYSRSGGSKKYPNFVKSTRYGEVDGLCGANCRHNFGPYFEGDENPFTQYDSKENQKQYEMEQRQRLMERRIRDTKRKTMGWKEAMDTEKDPVKKAEFESEYQKKAALLQKQNAAYNEFCEQTGQTKRSERISIAKWDRDQAAQARAAVKRRENNLKFIDEDATIKAQSNLPKKLERIPDEKLQHTINIDFYSRNIATGEIHAIAPQGAVLENVEVMAGSGTSTPIRDLRRLYEAYNLDAKNWQKKSGTAYAKEYHYVIHWYENNGYVPIEEIKLKGMKKNK